MPPADEQTVDVNQLNMLELAGYNMSEVKEVRHERLPQAVYIFEATKEERVKETGKEKDSEDDCPKFVAKIELTIKEVVQMLGVPDPTINVAELVGKKMVHRISKNIEQSSGVADLMKFMGMVKAFALDIGAIHKDANITFDDMCRALIGRQFKAPVKHVADRNDKDKVYANLNTDKIKPA